MLKFFYRIVVFFVCVLSLTVWAGAGNKHSLNSTGVNKTSKSQAKIYKKLTTDTQFNEVVRFNKNKLLQKTSKQKYVRVLVRIKGDYISETKLSKKNRQKQRTRLRVKQNRIEARLSANSYASKLTTLPGEKITRIKKFNRIPYMTLDVDEQKLQELYAMDDVLTVEEDVLIRPSSLDIASFIGADSSWKKGYTGTGQTIAILDTGIQSDHQYLQGKIVSEACFSTTYANGESLCPDGSEEQYGIGAGVDCFGVIDSNFADMPCGHGTQVAGIAAGWADTVTGDGDILSGIANEANIISIQVFSQQNSPDVCAPNPAPCLMAYYSDLVSALEYIYSLRNQYNIAAVNMSLSGDVHADVCDTYYSFKLQADLLKDVGIPVIAASGNDGAINGVAFPGCISSVVSVGATDLSDEVLGSSNSADFLDFLAPGSSYVNGILSSVVGKGATCNPNCFYFGSGTSMAVPQVSAAFALLNDAVPNLSVDQKLEVLTKTGSSIADFRNNVVKPRIDINDAIVQAITNAPPVIAVLKPSYGKSGDWVNIKGKYLRGVTDVQFGRTPAEFWYYEGQNFIYARVPEGATTSDVTVIKPAGESSTKDNAFKYITTNEPIIMNVSRGSPRMNPIFYAVEGYNLQSPKALYKNGAWPSGWQKYNKNLIVVLDLQGGRPTVNTITVVTDNGSAKWSPDAPVIDKLSSLTGQPGDIIEIKGKRFVQGDTSVKFNGIPANTDEVSVHPNQTKLTVEIPFGASTGTIEVVTPAGTGKTFYDFTIE